MLQNMSLDDLKKIAKLRRIKNQAKIFLKIIILNILVITQPMS